MQEVQVKRFRPETEAECHSIDCIKCIYSETPGIPTCSRPKSWEGK